MHKILACLLSFTLINLQLVKAQNSLPTLHRVEKPSGVSAPGEMFNPPLDGNAPSEAPQVAEWTRTAGPDESVVITGSNLSRYSGKEEGKDTRFTVYSSNGLQKDANIQRLDGDKAIITMPNDLSRWGMYLIWPGNERGYGAPLAINKTDLWWVGPNQAAKGSIASVFGRNLANQNGTALSYVYLKSTTSGDGQWAEVVKVNPYRVDFRVPTSLPVGDYEVWAHNGHGGDYGWSGPAKLNINNGPQWTSKVFNVKDFGARGDGSSDDVEAIRRAVLASSKSPGATVYFPAGTYMISNYLDIFRNTRWQGEGPEKTTIKCSPNFAGDATGMLFSNKEDVIDIDGITFNTNYNFRGKLDKPIFFRNSSDIRFNNVKFIFHGYNVLDLHEAERVFITNCEMIGKVTFLGSGTQIFIDNCTFKQTNNSNNAIYSWAGSCVSVTNSTCQDLDNSNWNSMDGWGTGRFFTGDGNWGANYHTYLANNTGKDLTISPLAADQNMGEIFMWEGTYTDFIGTISSTTDTRTALNGYGAPDGHTRYAVIIKGKGFGQSRRITQTSGNTITLNEPWNVVPDNSSVIAVGRYIDRIVVYNNYLDGKPRAVQNVKHIAAAGIQPFSATFNFIADNNTLHELRQGTSNWAMFNSNGRIEPNYFSMYVNNKYINCRDAILNMVPVQTKEYTAMFGTIYRRNEVQRPMLSGATSSVYVVDAPTINSTIYEHNVMDQAPIAIEVQPIHYSPTVYGAANQIIYKNRFTGNGTGPAIKMQPGMAIRENIYSGFTKNQTSQLIAKNTVEGPNRVIFVTAPNNSTNVEAPLTIWNSGSVNMDWSLSENISWLTPSETSGTIETEFGKATIALRINPQGMASGIYKETFYVNSDGRILSFTVVLQIGNTPQTQSPKISISAPTQNATFTESETVNVAAEIESTDAVQYVEFYVNDQKAGVDNSFPFSFQVSGLKQGQHAISAKVFTNGGRSAQSNKNNITVNPKVYAAPTVAITAPLHGAQFDAGQNVAVTADAKAQESNIKVVRFYLGSTLLNEDYSMPYTANLTGLKAGTHTIVAQAIDDRQMQVYSKEVIISVKDAPQPSSPTACTGTGSITWEYYYNIPWGTPLTYERSASFAPNGTRTLSSFSSPRNFANNYAARAMGYICPPYTGEYTFFLSSDDYGELWLSTDDNIMNGKKIAYVKGYAKVNEYNKYASQKSVSIYLQAGKRYFIESLHLDNGSDDHLSVAWQMPNGTFQSPIAGQYLIPYTPSAAKYSIAAKAGTFSMNADPAAYLEVGGSSTLEVSPNPVQGAASLRFSVAESGKSVVELYNAQGALVSRLFNGNTQKGQTYQVPINGSTLPTGIYYCRLTSGATVLQKQVVIAR